MNSAMRAAVLVTFAAIAPNAMAQSPSPPPNMPQRPMIPPSMPAGPLSLEVAHDAAVAALAACKTIGYPNATAVVVDTGGHTLVVWRSPTAVDPTIEAARRKAYTAAKTGGTSEAFGKSLGWVPGPERPGQKLPPGAVRVKDAPVGVGSIVYNGDPGLTPMGGGVPIMSHGKIVGAVGLSGAMGPVKDAQCSQAGADAVLDKAE